MAPGDAAKSSAKANSATPANVNELGASDVTRRQAENLVGRGEGDEKPLQVKTGTTAAVFDFELLPDLALLTIMDHLPMTNLIHSNEVCRRWYHLRPVAMNRRQSLYLLENWQDQKFLDTPPEWNFSMLKEAVVTNDRGEEKPLVTPKPYLDQNYLILPAFDMVAIDKILELLPNIKVLRIVHRDVEETSLECLKVQLLLSTYRAHLTELSFEIWCAEEMSSKYASIEERDSAVREHLLSLLRAINRLPALKKLSLNLQTSATSNVTILLDLPIIRQLELLNIRTWGFNPRDQHDSNVLLLSLTKYVAESPNLQSIIQHHFVNLTRMLAIDRLSRGVLGPKYLLIQLETTISPENFEQMKTFATRFVNVRDLSLCRVEGLTLASLVEALKPMTQLGHLSVTLNFDPNRGTVSQHSDLAEDKLPSLSSVIALSLFIDTASHKDIAKLKLHRLFPNVQVMLLRHTASSCASCGYELTRRRVPSEILTSECARLGRVPLKKLSALRRLHANTQPSRLIESDDALFTLEDIDQLPTDENTVYWGFE